MAREISDVVAIYSSTAAAMVAAISLTRVMVWPTPSIAATACSVENRQGFPLSALCGNGRQNS
jgi:hypothetical protein